MLKMLGNAADTDTEPSKTNVRLRDTSSRDPSDRNTANGAWRGYRFGQSRPSVDLVTSCSFAELRFVEISLHGQRVGTVYGPSPRSETAAVTCWAAATGSTPARHGGRRLARVPGFSFSAVTARVANRTTQGVH